MHDTEIACYAFLVGVACCLVYRLFHPWSCVCGYLTWRASKMMRHIELKHVHVHGESR